MVKWGWVITGALAVIIVIAYATSSQTSKHDDFAKCLSDNGAIFYGAYWCPHCAAQKEMFGNSMKFVNYVECSLPNKGGQTEACTMAGITSYPTWQFKDGSRETGVLSLDVLAQKTGC